MNNKEISLTKWLSIILFWITVQPSVLAQQCLSHCSPELELKNEHIIEDWLNNHRTDHKDRMPITISVVFHIVYNTASENISDEQIMSQLEVLNEDFRLLNENQSLVTWPSFQTSMADMELNFQLAEKDPWGMPTTGIVRRFTSIPRIALKLSDGRRRICYDDLGGSDAWCPEHYLNIWVGKFNEGFFAETSFPGQDIAPEDGIRIDPFRVGRDGSAIAPNHLGRTLTHEIGHYFSLQHLWGSGSANPSCTDDDGISDTPQQAFTYAGECPGNFNLQSCGSRDQFPNYLNYTDDACMAMFTKGQKERVWAILNTLRQGLKVPASCGMVPTEDFLIANDIHISISPNPAYGQVEIYVKSSQSFEGSLEIIGADAHLVAVHKFASNTPFYLDKTTFSTGLYLLKFNILDFFVFRKLIILS